MTRQNDSEAVICIENEGNEASLQVWKIYKSLRDDDALSEGFMRVIDESGEDYLFPEEIFARIELPHDVRKSFERAIRKQRQGAGVSSSTRRLR
jgi:hypothetical protein